MCEEFARFELIAVKKSVGKGVGKILEMKLDMV